MVSSYVLVSTIIIGFLSPLIFSAEFNQVYRDQVQKEFLASNVYLTFAHRLATQGIYHGFANFFFESAEEERGHGKMLIDFNNVRDRELILNEIKIDDDIADMVDLTKMIKKAEELEQDVYNNLIKLRQAAFDEKDYPTVHFIEKQMLEEQTTALKYVKDLVRRIDRNSNNSMVLLQMMDQDLRKKQIKKP